MLLTLFGAMQYGGTLVSPIFGVAGDRIGYRNLLCGMRAAYSVLASVLVAVALAGALTPTLVFLIAGATGLVRPSDLGVRLSMMAGIVGPQELTTATGVARTTSDFARVGGALTGAGMFAAFGIGQRLAHRRRGPLRVRAAVYRGHPRVSPRMSPATDHAVAPAGVVLRPSAWHELKEGLVSTPGRRPSCWRPCRSPSW